MVLETVGRRSGRRRAVPVLYLRDGESFIVMASNAGTDRYPTWWLNLRDADEATIIVRGSRNRVRPRILEGTERERLWRAFVDMYPQADEYARFTEREIPLVALEPV
jgi:deazaflavin-dependent oxidoreductase (nitroreductase family)